MGGFGRCGVIGRICRVVLCLHSVCTFVDLVSVIDRSGLPKSERSVEDARLWFSADDGNTPGVERMRVRQCLGTILTASLLFVGCSPDESSTGTASPVYEYVGLPDFGEMDTVVDVDGVEEGRRVEASIASCMASKGQELSLIHI